MSEPRKNPFKRTHRSFGQKYQTGKKISKSLTRYHNHNNGVWTKTKEEEGEKDKEE